MLIALDQSPDDVDGLKALVAGVSNQSPLATHPMRPSKRNVTEPLFTYIIQRFNTVQGSFSGAGLARIEPLSRRARTNYPAK
jgi:16S rRNA G966 N2-methylase RsmD